MRLIAKIIRISDAKFHCNRLTAVQDIQDYASLIFWGHGVESVNNCGLQTAVTKVQEMTTKAQENASAKMTESDVQSMHSRADTITYAVLAEVQHFEQLRVSNFRDYMTQYLQGQIEFYKTASRSRLFLHIHQEHQSFDRRTFPIPCSTCSWQVTTYVYVGKPSAIGQPTRPTQPFILLGQ